MWKFVVWFYFCWAQAAQLLPSSGPDVPPGHLELLLCTSFPQNLLYHLHARQKKMLEDVKARKGSSYLTCLKMKRRTGSHWECV